MCVCDKHRPCLSLHLECFKALLPRKTSSNSTDTQKPSRSTVLARAVSQTHNIYIYIGEALDHLFFMTYFCTYAIHKVLWQGLIFHAFNAVFPRSSCTFSTLPTMFFHTFPVHFPHFHRCFSTHSPHIFHAFSVVYSTHSPRITILCSIVPSLFFSARSRLIVYTSCVVAHTSKTAAI